MNISRRQLRQLIESTIKEAKLTWNDIGWWENWENPMVGKKIDEMNDRLVRLGYKKDKKTGEYDLSELGLINVKHYACPPGQKFSKGNCKGDISIPNEWKNKNWKLNTEGTGLIPATTEGIEIAKKIYRLFPKQKK